MFFNRIINCQNWFILFIICILCSTLIFTPYFYAKSTSDYPKYGYNNRHTASVKSKGPLNNPDVLWVLKSKSKITGAPITSKGKLYFGDLDNFIYSVNGESGKVLWFKKLKNRQLQTIGIHNTPAFFKKLVIIANGDGFLYALDKESGRLIWGPIDLKENIYSSPIIYNKLIFITTAGNGLLWILKASTGELVFKKPISIDSPVYSTSVLRKDPQRKNIIYFYITTKSKLVTYRIDLDLKKHSLIKSLSIDETIVSSPTLYKSKLYFTTQQFLYCIKLSIHKPYQNILWIKKQKPFNIYPLRKTYPSLVLTQSMIFHGNRAYNANDGMNIWHLWSYGIIKTDSVASPDILYIGGEYKLYDQLHGFVAGVNIKTKGIVFWYNLNSSPLSPLILANGTLFFSTEDQKFYALK